MDESAEVPVSTPLDVWLAELAQPRGAPGGGAASGVMVGIAASLLGMVAEYTPEDERAKECGARVRRVRARALDAAESDGVASQGFGAALALPSDDPQREARVRKSAVEAAESAALLGAVGVDLLPELRTLVEVGNPHLRADLDVAGEALIAGLAGASITLRANLQLARDHDAPESVTSGLDAEVARLADARRGVAEILEDSRGGDARE